MKSEIRIKLDAFIAAYYKQRFVRGLMLAMAVTLLTLVGLFLLENQLWLSVQSRTILFFGMWTLIIALWGVLVLQPFLKLRGVGKVISHQEAARWIGNHFSDVSDKLLNLLQLEDMSATSVENDLLLQGIAQKTVAFSNTPFIQALDWLKHKRWMSRLALLLVLLLGFSAYQSAGIINGANRVFHYQTEYVPQAPFRVELTPAELVADQGKDLIVNFKVEGSILPENIEIIIDKQVIRAKKIKPNHFQYTFSSVQAQFDFGIRAMDFDLGHYQVNVNHPPQWQALSAWADYPEYTGKIDGECASTELLEVPEGTIVTYELKGKYVNQWLVKSFGGRWTSIGGLGEKGDLAKGQETTNHLNIAKEQQQYKVRANSSGGFVFGMRGKKGLSVDTFLSRLEVQKDLFPDIQCETQEDSVKMGVWYFMGLAGDDYAVKSVHFYHRILRKNGRSADTNWVKMPLFIGNESQVSFTHALDLGLMGIQPGDAIEYQLAATDNDALHGGKVMRTPVRKLERPSNDAVVAQLEKQEAGIGQGMSKSVKNLEKLQKEAKRLQESLQQSGQSWDQENKIKNWLNEEQKILQTIKQLEKKQSEVNKQKQRLGEQSQELQKKKDALNDRLKQLNNPEMQKLIDEIQRLLQQKADKEQLKESMQKLSEMSHETAKEMDKLMEQLKQLELEEAVDAVAKSMEDWAKKEEELAQQTKEEKGNQTSDALKEAHEEQKAALQNIEKKIQDVEEKNAELEKPMELKTGEEDRKEAGDEAQKASQDLQNNKKSAASEKMKKSAQKMKDAMQNMQKSFEDQQKKRAAEDYQTLRALLENLIDASNRQEANFMELRKLSSDNPRLATLNKEQMRLRESLMFIEDSLMALAKRQPMIDNFVTKEMSRVNVQMGMALDNMKVRNSRGAAVHEQFVMTGLNNLADMLMESLQNMQQQMQSDQKKDGDKSCNNPNKSGKGKSGKPKPGGKLSDAQKALGEQLQKMQQQKRGKPGESGKQGEQGSPKTPGSQGESSQDGQRSLNEDLAKMALMQEALRRQVEQLRKELGQEGKQGLSNGLQEVEKMMERQEKDIVNGKITPQSIERQKQIMTRLLENEKADRKQDQEDKRESNNPGNYIPEVPDDIKEAMRKKSEERESMRRIQPAFKPYYKQSVQKYLQIYSR